MNDLVTIITTGRVTADLELKTSQMVRTPNTSSSAWQ